MPLDSCFCIAISEMKPHTLGGAVCFLPKTEKRPHLGGRIRRAGEIRSRQKRAHSVFHR